MSAGNAESKPEEILGTCAGVLLPLVLASLYNIFSLCETLPTGGACTETLMQQLPELAESLARAMSVLLPVDTPWPKLPEYLAEEQVVLAHKLRTFL